MANIGPLDSFAFPGTYTRTLSNEVTASIAGGAKIPAVIGVGLEQDRVSLEIARGSAVGADQAIGGEDFTHNGVVDPFLVWNVIDGVNNEFHTAYKPIVDGSGYGIITNKTSSVVVTVNGVAVPVESVDGVKGVIKLVEAPAVGSTLRAALYYFKRTDSYIKNENLSVQADGTTVTFQVESGRIVDGKNGGTSATGSIVGTTVNTTAPDGTVLTVSAISATVNGASANIIAVNGGAGTFTLDTAPLAGEVVLVSYFANDLANTYDIIPVEKVNTLLTVGFKENDPFWKVGTTCILSGDNKIVWGSTALVNPGVTTVQPGKVELGSTQVHAVVVDNKYYGLQVGTAGTGSQKNFTLPYPPTRGDGTGRSLSDFTNGTPVVYSDDVLKAYVGTSYTTAIAAGPVAIAKVVGQVITLKDAPALNALVFVDQYAGNLADESWTVTAGSTGSTYAVLGTKYGTIRQVSYKNTSTISPEPSYLDNVAPFVKASAAYTGTDTYTVTGATGAFLVSSATLGNTGSFHAGQTYIDSLTGFTITTPANLSNGTLVYEVNPLFSVKTTSEYGLFGLKLDVGFTGANVVSGDTAVVTALNMVNEEEPAVGTIYTVTFDKARTDFSPKYITNRNDLVNILGPRTQGNRLHIGADLAFANGASAVIIKQIPKVAGGTDASVADYIAAIDVFDEPMSNGVRPSLMQPLSSDPQVTNYLKVSNATQSSIRYRNERMSYFGFRIGTTPDTVINRVRSLASELLVAVYPDGGFITVRDDSNTYDIQVQVGGEYVAVAMAGLDASPAQDIATPLTNKTLAGFSKLSRALTTVVASQVANAGTTVLEYIPGGTVRVMMALTTDTTSVLTRDPRIVGVSQFVQKGVRNTLDPFIGKKNLPGLTGDIETTLKQFFASLISQQLIAGVQGISAVVNSADPSTVDVTAYYSPVLPLNWIVVTLNLRSQG